MLVEIAFAITLIAIVLCGNNLLKESIKEQEKNLARARQLKAEAEKSLPPYISIRLEKNMKELGLGA